MVKNRNHYNFHNNEHREEEKIKRFQNGARVSEKGWALRGRRRRRRLTGAPFMEQKKKDRARFWNEWPGVENRILPVDRLDPLADFVVLSLPSGFCLFVLFLRLAGLWNASRINDLSRSFVFFVGVRPSYFGSGSTFRRESDAPLTSSSIDIYRLPSSARPYWVSLVFRSLLLLLLLLPSGFAFPVGSAGFTSRVESTFFCLFVFFGFGSGVYRVGGRNCHQKIKWATHTWSGTFQNNQFEKKTKKKRMSRSTAAGNSGSIRSGSFFFAFIPKLKQKKTRLRNSAHLSRWRFIGRWAGRKIHRKHLAASRSDNEKRTSTATPMMAPFYEGYRVFTSV